MHVGSLNWPRHITPNCQQQEGVIQSRQCGEELLDIENSQESPVSLLMLLYQTLSFKTMIEKDSVELTPLPLQALLIDLLDLHLTSQDAVVRQP